VQELTIEAPIAEQITPPPAMPVATPISMPKKGKFPVLILRPRVENRNDRNFWLVSLLFHAGILLLIYGLTLSQVFEKEDSGPLFITELQMNALFVTPEPVPETLAQRIIEDEKLTPEESRALDERILEVAEVLPQSEEIETQPVLALQDDTGDGKPAAGDGEELSAGSIDDQGVEIGGEETWDKIRPRLIGRGSSGAVNGKGTGDQAAGGVSGGTGQGTGGVIGSGMGRGTTGGTGTGERHTAITRAVQVEYYTGGQYPSRARKEGREGVVRLRVEVLTTGNVGKIEIASTSGHTDLDETAAKAAKQWRFKPAISNDQPVVTWVVVPVRYVLSAK
jgi:TonB family protein